MVYLRNTIIVGDLAEEITSHEVEIMLETGEGGCQIGEIEAYSLDSANATPDFLTGSFDEIHDASYWVAELGDPVTGLLKCGLSCNLLYIHRVFVEPEHRRSHYGMIAIDQLVRSFGGPTYAITVADPEEDAMPGLSDEDSLASLIRYAERAGFVRTSPGERVLVRDSTLEFRMDLKK